MTNEQVFALVEPHRELILQAERDLWKTPETGYKEWKTQRYAADRFEALGYTLTYAGDIPGFFTDIDTGLPGPTLLIMGELDSLLCANHPDADPATGAVHACGHHAQMAALIGLAAALKEPGALDGLCGKIRLCAVPAEELIEVGWREELRKAGTIKYLGGKVEFMWRGYFKDVDLSFMIHTGGGFSYSDGSNGCIAKSITYKGKASHAGGSPQAGINALYAANLGMTAVNALRETFPDNDHIRFHPIVTSGGIVVNAIPEKATMESYVRGKTLDATVRENRKINRALAASAAAIGANVELCDRPGYCPLINAPGLMEVCYAAALAYTGKDWLQPNQTLTHTGNWGTGCTDMGDISAVMPAIHPYAGGAAGTGHGADYHIADPEAACVGSAKVQLLMARMLLENDAALAKRTIETFEPRFASQEAYFEFMDKLTLDREAVVYHEDGTVGLDFANN